MIAIALIERIVSVMAFYKGECQGKYFSLDRSRNTFPWLPAPLTIEDNLSCGWTNQRVALNYRETADGEGNVATVEIQ